MKQERLDEQVAQADAPKWTAQSFMWHLAKVTKRKWSKEGKRQMDSHSISNADEAKS